MYKNHKGLIKFLLLLAVLVIYFGYLSWKFDIATGGIVSALTWSFFVLCTPVADAGFLLDFPVRLILGWRMIITEIWVWVIAIGINLIVLTLMPEVYDKSLLTHLLYQILTTPWPYWSIVLLCGVGTFLSIYFGDNLMDVLSHKECVAHCKKKLLVMAVLVGFIFLAYADLLQALDIHFE